MNRSRNEQEHRRLVFGSMLPWIEALASIVAERVAGLLGHRLQPSLEGGASGPLLDVHAAASYLSLSPSTIYKLSAKGKIPKIKLGGRVRFRRSDLDAYVADHHRGDAAVVQLATQLRAGRSAGNNRGR